MEWRSWLQTQLLLTYITLDVLNFSTMEAEVSAAGAQTLLLLGYDTSFIGNGMEIRILVTGCRASFR